MWSPNIIFLVFALILLRQTANEKPMFPTALSNAWVALITRLLPPLTARLRSFMHLPPKKIPQKTATEKYLFEQPSDEFPGGGHLTVGTIHGNVKTGICHLPGCASYSCLDCTVEFKDMEIAGKAGFTPCPACILLLEKQNKTAPEAAADKRTH